jgi:hypothetical protein
LLLLSFRYLVAAIASLHPTRFVPPPKIYRIPLKPRHRTSYFAYISSLSYAFSLFGPILASTTMSLTLWLPFYLGTGLLIGALLSDGEEDAELLGF